MQIFKCQMIKEHSVFLSIRPSVYVLKLENRWKILRSEPLGPYYG
jgi:hypothetical protein